MALIACNECRKEISDQAKSCPSCGAPIKKPKKSIGAGTIILVVAVVFWAFVFLPKGGSSNSSSDYQMMAAAKKSVLKMLKDPDSAEFRNEHVGTGGIPCGEVNAKNSFGGYTGFKRYLGFDELLMVEDSMKNDQAFEKLWMDHC